MKSEYDLYKTIQRIATEFFMNQFTGGFPREANVISDSRKIGRQVDKALKEINSGISEGEAWHDATITLAKAEVEE